MSTEDGDALEPQHPSVQRYQINNLFEQMARMRQDMKEGFADLRGVLDSRLESRDRQLEDHESRIRVLEGRTDRQQVVNAVLAAVGGAALALVARVLVVA